MYHTKQNVPLSKTSTLLDFFGFLQLKRSEGKCGLGLSLLWEGAYKLSSKH